MYALLLLYTTDGTLIQCNESLHKRHTDPTHVYPSLLMWNFPLLNVEAILGSFGEATYLLFNPSFSSSWMDYVKHRYGEVQKIPPIS